MGEPPLGIVYLDRGFRYSRSQGSHISLKKASSLLVPRVPPKSCDFV